MHSLKILLALMLVVSTAPSQVWAREKGREKARGKPVKVTELLRVANETMDEASAAYVDGKTQEALDLYRQAMEELERLEDQEPLRATSAEFAPVRFRRALCETEIDRIMLEEMNATARTVTVTDTTELAARREARKREAETNNLPEVAVKLGTKKGQAPVSDTTGKGAVEPRDAKAIAAELEWAKELISIDHFEEAESALIKILKADPGSRDARFLMALARLRQDRHGDALVVLDDILQETPNDEAALMLAAGAYMASGAFSRAMDALDKVLRLSPKRPEGYHNMAWLLLEMNPANLDDPEQYYRQAVKLGGPRDRDLERRLGIKAE